MRIKKIITATILAIILLTLVVLGVFAAIYFSNEVESQNDLGLVTDNAEMSVTPNEQHGMYLATAVIPREQYDAYGVSTIAESAQTITATIIPANAVNKELDWSIAWKDAGSTWAKGKSISDYLTLTPTSDGALTATVSCKKAFGEQAIVTCQVRTDDTLTATCTVDYKKRVLGIDFSVKLTWAQNQVPVDWQFVHTNLNPTVDFIPFKYAWTFQDWALGFCDSSNTTSPVTHFPSEGTKSGGSWAGVTLSAAPTAEYIAALKAAGFTTTVDAEQYVTIVSTNNNGLGLSVGNLILSKFIAKRSGSSSNDGINNYTQFEKLQTYLREHSSSVMLRFKLEMIGADTSIDKPTIYNVKFSSDSLQARAQGLSLSGGIDF